MGIKYLFISCYSNREGSHAKGDDLHATTSLLCAAKPVTDICTWYTWLEASGSLFSCATTQSIFLTSEQVVMANLVEAAQAILWLRENCTRLLEFSTKMTFRTQLGGMFLVYIPHVLLCMIQCRFENF